MKTLKYGTKGTVFDFFVQKGCDPNEQLKPHGLMKFAVRTMRALKFVAPKKFSEVDEMVDFMGGGGTPLHRASGAMVGSVKNMQKLIENGAKNDGVDRYGQLPIDNLLKFHPDSKAPDILGSGLVPPAEKLRRASKAIMTMNKMNTMTGGKEVLGDEATRAAARVCRRRDDVSVECGSGGDPGHGGVGGSGAMCWSVSD